MAIISGIEHVRDGVEPALIVGLDMSIIGVIGTAEGAEVAKFPLNEPVFVRTSDSALRAALGSTGTLPDALAGISAQLEDGAARVVVVRVAEGVDAKATIANMVGNEENRTGIWGFLDAGKELSYIPRIIIAPGYTSQTESGLGSTTISAAGSGGTDGTFALAFTGGTGSGAAGTFTVTSGAVTSVLITDPGVYTVAPTLDLTASAGLTGATVTVALAQLANGVCAAIPTVLDRLKAVFIPEGPTSSRQAYLDWLETLPASARIIHPLRVDAKVLDDDGDPVVKPMSPHIAGDYVRRDGENQGVPSGSIHNQSVFGIVGVTPNIDFSFTDGSTEGQDDLGVSAGIVVRGDIGVDGAVGSTGFTFLGTDTLSSEDQWRFAHVVRMRDYIELVNARMQVQYLGKQNITIQTVEVLLNNLRSLFSLLAKDDHILPDFKIAFSPDANSPADLRAGTVDLAFAVEEPPVLRKIINRSRRNPDALVGLTQRISTQLGASQSL